MAVKNIPVTLATMRGDEGIIGWGELEENGHIVIHVIDHVLVEKIDNLFSNSDIVGFTLGLAFRVPNSMPEIKTPVEERDAP